MWHRDENRYNTKKFNADVDLLNYEFSNDDGEELEAFWLYL